MQKFFENKLTFVAILLLFTLALVCNAALGAAPAKVDEVTKAKYGLHAILRGPNVPTDPWDLTQHSAKRGPNVPTDPWDLTASNRGPNVPTDPWDLTNRSAKRGPNVPTDPWDLTASTKTQRGPNVPTDPWDLASVA